MGDIRRLEPVARVHQDKPGCKYCYVYRQDEMYGSVISSSECRKTANFNLPVKRKRDKSWKIESGKIVFTCFTSDFLLADADLWRPECWLPWRHLALHRRRGRQLLASTCNDDRQAYALLFIEGLVNASAECTYEKDRGYGRSVRLVRDKK